MDRAPGAAQSRSSNTVSARTVVALAALGLPGLNSFVGEFMTLLGAWTALLHQLSRQREIIVGTPVANRNQAAA